MQLFEGHPCAPSVEGAIAIIVARFNQTITEKLLEGALGKLREYMVDEDQIVVARVPGAFEIPTIAEYMASDQRYAAIICLGCVIKGETPHDEYINSAVSSQLARIGAEYGIPVIFGMLTCLNVEQALARSGQAEVGKDKALGEQPGNKGAEAAEAALEMLDLLDKLPQPEGEGDSNDFLASIVRNSKRLSDGMFDYQDEFQDDEDDEEEDAELPWTPGEFSHSPKERPKSFHSNRGNADKSSHRPGGSKHAQSSRGGKGGSFPSKGGKGGKGGKPSKKR